MIRIRLWLDDVNREGDSLFAKGRRYFGGESVYHFLIIFSFCDNCFTAGTWYNKDPRYGLFMF